MSSTMETNVMLIKHLLNIVSLKRMAQLLDVGMEEDLALKVLTQVLIV